MSRGNLSRPAPAAPSAWPGADEPKRWTKPMSRGTFTWRMQERAPEGCGYVYLFKSEAGWLKVGKTVQPRVRVYRIFPHQEIPAGWWISPALPAYSRVERELLCFCRERYAQGDLGTEYFVDVDYQAVQLRAAELVAECWTDWGPPRA